MANGKEEISTAISVRHGPGERNSTAVRGEREAAGSEQSLKLPPGH